MGDLKDSDKRDAVLLTVSKQREEFLDLAPHCIETIAAMTRIELSDSWSRICMTIAKNLQQISLFLKGYLVKQKVGIYHF